MGSFVLLAIEGLKKKDGWLLYENQFLRKTKKNRKQRGSFASMQGAARGMYKLRGSRRTAYVLDERLLSRGASILPAGA